MLKTTRNDRSSYMIQLDALRAVAVLGVLVHHFLPQEFILNRLNWGPLGVRLFFVLSGFLITGILLRCKDTIEETKQDIFFTIKKFYIRRFIRLLPIYYLTLLVSAIFRLKQIKSSLVWHLTYTSNIYFSFNNWDSMTSHFWSLSVESQFYLFWPFLIFLTPRKFLGQLIFLTILSGPLFRFLLIALNLTDGTREYILTFACMDSIGMGAMLAFCNHYQIWQESVKKIIINAFFWGGLPLCIIVNLSSVRNLDNSLIVVVGYTISSIFFAGLIAQAAKGFRGTAGKIIEWKPISYIGKISYGIYIYHLFAGHVTPYIFSRLGFVYPSSIWIQFLLKVFVTFIIAILSWQFFEKPINGFKQKFGYQK